MVCYKEEKLPRDKNKEIIKNNNINENNYSNNAHSHSPKDKENKKIIKKEKKEESHYKEKKMNIKEIFNEVNNKHNKIRKLYKNQELKLNNDLTILAQKFADNFDLLEEGNIPIEKYKGENLGINYAKFNEDINYIINICDKWIKEKELLDKKIYNSKTKHFTQIIWKKTKEIGFGYSKLNNGENIFVVYYYPAGNIFNEFKENINI